MPLESCGSCSEDRSIMSSSAKADETEQAVYSSQVIWRDIIRSGQAYEDDDVDDDADEDADDEDDGDDIDDDHGGLVVMTSCLLGREEEEEQRQK